MVFSVTMVFAVTMVIAVTMVFAVTLVLAITVLFAIKTIEFVFSLPLECHSPHQWGYGNLADLQMGFFLGPYRLLYCLQYGICQQNVALFLFNKIIWLKLNKHLI